jgi:1-acyl-sn-glycerol-3-phosphate acyltransferase
MVNKMIISAKKILKVLKVFSLTGKYLRFTYADAVDFIELKYQWGKEILNHFNVKILVQGKLSTANGPLILVGNHISYLDIPILFYTCPNISFVSKKEIKSWPIIGSAAAKVSTIFVERENAKSRSMAKSIITNSLLEDNIKLVIFPSGTTSIAPTSQWKKGAFEIALKNKIKIQPFRIHYTPLRDAAYIDQDNFLTHMYKLFNLKRLEVNLEFHTPVEVNDLLTECEYWKNWCEGQC